MRDAWTEVFCDTHLLSFILPGKGYHVMDMVGTLASAILSVASLAACCSMRYTSIAHAACRIKELLKMVLHMARAHGQCDQDRIACTHKHTYNCSYHDSHGC